MVSDRPTPHRDETTGESVPLTTSTASRPDETSDGQSVPLTTSSTSRTDETMGGESVPLTASTTSHADETTVGESAPLTTASASRTVGFTLGDSPPLMTATTPHQRPAKITVGECVPLLAPASPCSVGSSHSDEITVEESVRLPAFPTSSSTASPGFLARLWTAVSTPFSGCMRAREERRAMDEAMRVRAHSLRAKRAALFRFEHNDSVVESDDSGHGGEADEEALAHRSFLEEILEARNKLRHWEKDLEQVSREIVSRK
ncbi:hypothetical protein PRIPAC_77185 [Pristionchus pacificus]|uniref:Uncharacterized protein n=1 Tax=Pristionchus pacificus TaxID=54126 RepID=A0A2A6BWM7_PRIPA|nr:hypothetical protein PRIPAC_77185 [Pristionchus pacificus]|eukprot:PDM70402.1 hypothetical protein PRIPAC_46648 [Pristionchus pacificus]